MPRRDDWQRRIKAIEAEYLAVRLAMNRLVEACRRDPTTCAGLKPGDLARASSSLEGTYITRTFAEFETGLRLYRESIRDTHPRTIDLLASLAALRGVSEDRRDKAHSVREYRNRLIHEREEPAEPIPLAAARGHLCSFFSYLPPQW